jgi:dTDP-4-dehydrorhamnose reductase
MKISIIGASGFIGSHLHDYLTENLPLDFRTIGTYYSNPWRDLIFLDMTEKDQIEKYLLVSKPDYIIMLAGSKDVKKCEEDNSFSYNINTKPIQNIIQIIMKHGTKTKLIFFSTDYVFGGEHGQYKTDSKPNPNTNYGCSNFLAEKILFKSNIDYKIIRTGAVIGNGAIFYNWLISSLKEDNKISLFDNVFYTPTPVELLDEIIHKIILNYEDIPQKILHVVGEQRLSRYEFGVIVQSLMNKNGLVMPEHIINSKSTFQRDLSLVQSDLIKQYQSRTLIEYLKRSLK